MEVRNTTNFIIFTLIFLVAMGAIIYFFSQHPMGADFTGFKVLTGDESGKLDSFIGERVAVRGKVEAEKADDLITVGTQKDVVAYIDKQFDPTKGRIGKTVNVGRDGREFKLVTDGGSIPVKGLPVQVFDHKSRIVSPQDPNRYMDTVRQGKVYSIFGTVQKGITGTAVLIPFRITNQEIKEVVDAAAKANKQMDFIRYLSVFAIVAIYVTAMMRGNVFGPPEPEETGDKDDKSGENGEKSKPSDAE